MEKRRLRQSFESQGCVSSLRHKDKRYFTYTGNSYVLTLPDIFPALLSLDFVLLLFHLFGEFLCGQTYWVLKFIT